MFRFYTTTICVLLVAALAQADHVQNTEIHAEAMKLTSILATGDVATKHVALLDRFHNKKGSPEDVPQLFQIMASDEVWFCSKNGKPRNLHAEAAAIIQSLPKAQKAADMAKLEGAAKGAWSLLGKRPSQHDLAMFAYRYRLTKKGKEALEQLIALGFNHGDWAMPWLYSQILLQDWNPAEISPGTLTQMRAIFAWSEKSPAEQFARAVEKFTPLKVPLKIKEIFQSPSATAESLLEPLQEKMGKAKLGGNPYSSSRLAELQKNTVNTSPVFPPASFLSRYALSPDFGEYLSYRTAMRFGVLKDPLLLFQTYSEPEWFEGTEHPPSHRFIGCAAADPLTALHDKDPDISQAALFSALRLSPSPEHGVRYLNWAFHSALIKRHEEVLTKHKRGESVEEIPGGQNVIDVLVDNASQYLATLGPRAMPLFRAGLRENFDPVTLTMLHALNSQGSNAEEALPEMASYANSPSPEIRRWTAMNYNNIAPGTPSLLPTLLSWLSDPEEGVRLTAAHGFKDLKKYAETLVPSLQNGFSEASAETREARATAMGHLGEAAHNTVPLLLNAVEKDPTVVVRLVSAQALGKIKGLDSTQVERLGVRLQSEEKSEVRYGLVEALAELRDKKSVPLILTALKWDTDASVHSYAAARLGDFPEHASEIVGPLTKAFEDSNSYSDIVPSLGKMGAAAEPAIPALLKRMKSSDPLAHYIVDALGKIGKRPDLVVPKLIQFYESPWCEYKSTVVTALGTFADESHEALNTLLKAMKNPDGEVREKTVQGLSHATKSAAKIVPLLEELLKTEKIDSIRSSIVDALGHLDPKNTERMIRFLTDGDASEKQGAFRFFSETKNRPKELVPVLVDLLRDFDPRYSFKVPEILGEMGADAASAAKPMAEILVEKNDNLLKWVGVFDALKNLGPHATEALPVLEKAIHPDAGLNHYQALMVFAIIGEMGEKAAPALPGIREALRSESPLHRYVAAAILPKIDPQHCEEAIPLLIDILEEKVPRLFHGDDGKFEKADVLKTLEAIGPRAKSAIPAIEAILQSNPEPAVKEAAEKALNALRS